MRNMMIFLLFAAAAAGSWWWYNKNHLSTDAGPGNGETSVTTGGYGEATKPPVAQPAGIMDDAPKNPGKLSPAGAIAQNMADQLWDQKAAKGSPEQSNDAPKIALLYSQVLRDSYNKGGLESLEKGLIENRLAPLAQSLFFSRTAYDNDDTGLFTSYLVQSGDLLDRGIGLTYGISPGFINILRGKRYDLSDIALGERLKIVKARDKGGFVIHIDKSDFTMDVFVGGVFIRRYPIGIGAVGSETPTGTTYIEARVWQAPWTNPTDRKVYKYGSTGHLIGPVWLAFNNKIGKSGLAIHGYTGSGPATGVKCSNGCIRMNNDQAIELYNILGPVVVESETGKLITRSPMAVEIVE